MIFSSCCGGYRWWYLGGSGLPRFRFKLEFLGSWEYSPAEAPDVRFILSHLWFSASLRIEDKGKEYGSNVKVGKFTWFVRKTGSPKSRRGTIVFLHGAPTQSYSYRVVMSQLADAGFHCFAPDWIGFGFSSKPQPGYGFDYTGLDTVYEVKMCSYFRLCPLSLLLKFLTFWIFIVIEKEFHDEFDKLLDVLGITSPFYLVVQGFLVGSYGLTWALKNPSKVSKIAILNTPLTVSSPIPGLFQKLSFSRKNLESQMLCALPWEVWELE